jgi:ribosome production factor 2
VYFRVYKVNLKKTGTKIPRVELEESGPALDLKIRRSQFASEDLYKEAISVPQVLRAKKVKNISRDILGKKGRIRIGKQDIERMPIKKSKILRKAKNSDDVVPPPQNPAGL